MRLFHTTYFIEAIRRKSRLGANSSNYSDLELIEIINEQIKSYVYPCLVKEDENYFLARVDVPMTEEITLPPYTAYNKIKEVFIITDDGYRICDLPIIEVGDTYRKGVFFRHNKLIFKEGYYEYFTRYSGAKIRIYYYNKPSEMTLNFATVESKTDNPDRITLNSNNSLDTGITRMVNNAPVTNLEANTPNGDEIKRAIVVGDITSRENIEVNSGFSDISVGDYITEEGFTYIFQFPEEFSYYLVLLCSYSLDIEVELKNIIGNELARAKENLEALTYNRVSDKSVLLDRDTGLKDDDYEDYSEYGGYYGYNGY